MTTATLVGPLVECLEDPDPAVREQAAWALGQIGDRRAIDPLLAAGCDRDEHVRDAARWALTSLDLDPLRAPFSQGETAGEVIADALRILHEGRNAG